MDITKLRNIGISAHIDSGKTTLSERILYYTGKIHTIHEVRGKDGVGATMDSMELEKERGITIASAATSVTWKGYDINLIDTPGHVDFTIEVENALRVLDGAILVLCSVGGVQSQTITVDRQLKRYDVPNLVFINKMDRSGADPVRVTGQVREKLGRNAVMMQLPIGSGDDFQGIIDLVKMVAVYYEGPNGDILVEKDIPADLYDYAVEKREQMLDQASMFSEELMEAFLEGNETEEMINKAVRIGTISRQLVPVFLGTAYKNKGVQKLLDAVLEYLPAPDDVTNYAYDVAAGDKEVPLTHSREDELVAMAFKLDNQVYGQLTYLRIYQGTLRKGTDITNIASGKRVKVGRLIRMHSDSMEDIQEGLAGDIIAMFGVECSLGDTFNSGDRVLSLKSMFVPEPIISLAINCKDNKSLNNMGKALNRFSKEDPTFKYEIDEESSQTIISGMGELHLDVYIERMRREYKVDLETGQPEVAYRESIGSEARFNYTHKKQSGGRGQFAKIAGAIRPVEGDSIFLDKITGGVIPSTYIPSVEKGFKASLLKGELTGFPVVGIEFELNDGSYHQVDSSQLAFEVASKAAFREVYKKANPYIMEPIMKIEVETPSEFRGNVMGSINQRRGIVLDTEVDDQFSRIIAEIPLSEIFGYATILRSLTQGKSEFSLEFSSYKRVPKQMEEKMLEDIRKRNAEKGK
ncbi:elongation factor G [bacterium]|nr:elongation factor G [bacterium]